MRSIFQRGGLLVRNTAGGFSLVELAVVIAIVALLLGALLTPLATQHQLRKNKEAERELREIKEALIGFAVANGRLPWPDLDFSPDGVENLPAGFALIPPTPPAVPCPVCEGLLPWQTLGLAPTDPWGRIYRYRISPEFGYPVQTGQPAGGVDQRFDLLDVGNVRINTRGDNPAVGGGGEQKEDIVLTTDAAAAVMTVGSNGSGGILPDTTAIAQAPVGTDERINSDGGTPAAPAPHFYARQLTLPATGACSDTVEGATFCEFDDLVMWIPRVVLINRMVEAGRLP
jgi:prepilin-type N-terminal cleavage/methylation domain-containing protein